MAEENKKGGFWASLFGRNKKQDEPKIEPIIEEEKIKDVEPSIEKFEANDLVEEEKIQEISTALEPVALEPVEEIIEAKNLEDDLQPVVEIETRGKPSEGGFFSRLVKGLLKTKQNVGAGFRSFFLGKKIDDELFEELEEQLLIADIGVPTTSKIIKNLTEHASRKELQDAELLYQQLKVEMADILESVAQPLEIDSTKKPYVILMVGVNGVGKTTTIGKLARKFQAEGKSVMLAAGDTFRAAAVEQLQ
ncbi:Signal recognition particle receptor FtsY, partial [Haemophilus influenzae]